MATKEPEVKRLFTHSITRYRVDANAQFDLFNNPQVERQDFVITADYCIPMKVVRLFVGGASAAWRNPITIDGGDYEAITTALVDLGEATLILPYYADPEEAIADWKSKKRGQLRGEEQQG